MNTETEAVMDKIVLVPAVIMVLAAMETIILVHIEEEDSMNLIYKKIVPKIHFHVSHNIYIVLN